jgi:hypothetical protein
MALEADDFDAIRVDLYCVIGKVKMARHQAQLDVCEAEYCSKS